MEKKEKKRELMFYWASSVKGPLCAQLSQEYSMCDNAMMTPAQ